MADLSSLFPQAPQPGAGNALIGDPAKAVGLMDAATRLRLLNDQYSALSQQPQAALTGQNIANQTSQMKQNEDATQIAAHYFGTLPDNATPDDIYRMKMAIRAVHPNISADTINTMADVALRDPKSIKNGIATLRTIGMSPEAMVSRVQGPPGAGGAPTTIPQTSAVRADGSITTALPPGETQLLEAPASRAEKLQATAGTSPQYHADLENLRQLSKDIPLSGPGLAEGEKKLNQIASRLGLPGTVTADQLSKAEEFDKIANQISLNQSTLFHGSDASLHTVVGANPSLSMSQIGREGVIGMLQGNQDAIDTARKAWLRARASGSVRAQDFDLFMDQVGQQLDPRVFQFNRMSKDNRQKFLDSIREPDELKRFEDNYKTAVKNKWVPPLSKADSGGQQQ
jgi:hypothetical protein